MLERNRENRTMLQMILRYAEKNGIDAGGAKHVGGEAELESAKRLEGLADIYRKWLTTNDAKIMLAKIFGR